MDRPARERASELIAQARPEIHIPVERPTVSLKPSVFDCAARVACPASSTAAEPAARHRQVRRGARRAQMFKTRSCAHQTQPRRSDHQQTAAPCSHRSLACSRQQTTRGRWPQLIMAAPGAGAHCRRSARVPSRRTAISSRADELFCGGRGCPLSDDLRAAVAPRGTAECLVTLRPAGFRYQGVRPRGNVEDTRCPGPCRSSTLAAQSGVSNRASLFRVVGRRGLLGGVGGRGPAGEQAKGLASRLRASCEADRVCTTSPRSATR